MQKRGSKGAIELSIGTIVILVLGVSMLILGIVLIRQIMCSALGLTGDVNSKVTGELNKLFGESGGEVACIGSGNAVKVIPGQTNIIYCSIKAPEQATYSIEVTGANSDSKTLTGAEVQSWITSQAFSQPISPSDRDPKKVVYLKIPNTAPESTISINLLVKKGGEQIATETLDFQISRAGFITNTLC